MRHIFLPFALVFFDFYFIKKEQKLIIVIFIKKKKKVKQVWNDMRTVFPFLG